jgi:hypothetical protein
VVCGGWGVAFGYLVGWMLLALVGFLAAHRRSA